MQTLILLPESHEPYPGERRLLTSISLFGSQVVHNFVIYIHGTPKRPNSRFRLQYQIPSRAPTIHHGELTDSQIAGIYEERGEGYELRSSSVLAIG